MKPLQPYHHAWLNSHPTRDEEWLRAKLKDGFHIHHLDGNHSNDDPLNLVLIDGVDHFRLHGALLIKRIGPKKGKRGPQRKRLRSKVNLIEVLAKKPHEPAEDIIARYKFLACQDNVPRVKQQPAPSPQPPPIVPDIQVIKYQMCEAEMRNQRQKPFEVFW
jgi:hypothetical protein